MKDSNSEFEKLNKNSDNYQAIFKKYGFELPFKESLEVYKLNSFYLSKRHFDKEGYKRKELAELSSLIKKSLNGGKSIKIKYDNINVEIMNKYNLEKILLFIDSLLEYEQNGIYKELFNLDSKKPLYQKYSRKKIEQIKQEIYLNIISDAELKRILNIDTIFSNFTEPYTDEETLKIVEYERFNYKKLDEHYNKKLVEAHLKRITATLKQGRIFDCDTKTIKTNEACFLFDLLVHFDIIEDDVSANNQDKYQFIKRHLK